MNLFLGILMGRWGLGIEEHRLMEFGGGTFFSHAFVGYRIREFGNGGIEFFGWRGVNYHTISEFIGEHDGASSAETCRRWLRGGV